MHGLCRLLAVVGEGGLGYVGVDPTPVPPPPTQKRARPARALWPLSTGRAQYESVRDLGAEYGVNHEATRKVAEMARLAGPTAP